PGTPTQSPQPTPQTPPTNHNPKTLSEIEKWVEDKNYDPLKGVNLAGVDLKGKSDNGKVSDLEELTIAEQKYLATKYKDYVQLSAAGDGNCFLHTFSVFLTGNSNVDMTLRLRVAMCLELMKNAEIYFKTESSEEDKI
ncbi:19392_t:CDS:2, partial [Racocetra persica]